MKRRKLLMIPGPIEFEPAVLRAMSVETASHVAPNFIACFQYCIKAFKEVLKAPNGQAFIVAGSGTLAMDMAATNLIEPGDKALVISTGYFGVRYENILKRYGAETTLLESDLGDVVSLDRIEQELKTGNYKLVTFTHVDTSTGVLVDPEPIAKLAQQYGALSILDGICSVAGEELKQEEWGVDVVVTASQKALGVPPGLALVMASSKAIKTWENRKHLVANYYADWENWLPIMQAYENGKPSYFGTPPVNLIVALETSLKLILEEGIDARIERHQNYARAFREALHAVGLELIASSNDHAAHTLSAVLYPTSIDSSDFTKKIGEKDVIVAGGLLPSFKTKYFRVGHMGSVSNNDLMATLSAIEYALGEAGYMYERGKSLVTFQRFLHD